jgi:serine/threonine protein kinase
MDDRRGERFGRYEILAELGRGAMGIVYKARDPKINRVVAIKTFSLAGQPPEEEREYRERFFREAEAAGRLSHPGIVTIFDVGEEPDTRAPYIVMEFVGGKTLEQLLSSEPGHKLSLDAALELTHELAEALDCAHGQGVVHRDLKPANILITEEGHAKIADFGIAKLNLANLTLAGRTLGTPAYMSPEQLNGESVDGRSDLFSLGVTLYTVLTGYRPFQGNSAMTVSYKVVNRDPIPASVLETELPQGLDYIISRAMAKDPAQRYQRGMEMALDIQDLREGRELWSKAKQPNSPIGSAAQPFGEKEKTLSKTQVRGPSRARSGVRAEFRGHGLSEKFLDKMRSKAAVGTLLLAGVLLFAFRLSRSIHFTEKSSPTAVRRTDVASQSLAGNMEPNATPPATPTAPAAEDSKDLAAAAAKTSLPAIRKAPAREKAVSNSAKVSQPPSPIVPKDPTTLEIEVDHKFAQAHLSIWVDGALAYTHLLEGTDKKRLVVFHHVQAHEFHAMQVPAGNHQLRVQVISDPDSGDHSATVNGQFASGKEQVLQVRFDKRGEMNLTLE